MITTMLVDCGPLGEIEIARTNARAERARLRTLYNATLPPGQLRIWSVA